MDEPIEAKGMDYRAFLVHVEVESPSSDARLALAGSLAKQFQAALIGVSGAAMPPLPMADPYGINIDAEIFREQEGRFKEDLKAAEKLFRESPFCKGLPIAWHSAVEAPVNIITQEARAADVVIVGRDWKRIREAPYQSVEPGDLLMRLGRPLLIVPPGTNRLEAKHVVIGWKDTREARRVIWDALPLLAKAERVIVISVSEIPDASPITLQADDIIAYLARHNVGAETEARTQREGSVADELILVAEQVEADLIVAGGYGHARLREWIFGGVTADLLQHSPKCCLLSH